RVAEVVVCAPPALPEALHEGLLELRVPLLPTVGDRELRYEEDRLGGGVGGYPALDLVDPEGGVFGRHLERVRVHLVDALVDPGDVGEDVGVCASPGRAVSRWERVELGGELPQREVLVGELVRIPGRRARARELGEVALRGAADGAHQEETLLGGGATGA